MRFFVDLEAGKESKIQHIGISYMLRGETGADFRDIHAEKPSQGKDWYHAGPHVMFVFPAASAKLLEGIPQDPSTGEPYIRPMPDGNAAIWSSPWPSRLRRYGPFVLRNRILRNERALSVIGNSRNNQAPWTPPRMRSPAATSHAPPPRLGDQCHPFDRESASRSHGGSV